MGEARQSLIRRFSEVVRKPGFWIILVLFVVLAVPHYHEALGYPAILTRIMTNLGLTRHAFERILFLIPVVWSGFLFGLKGTAIASLVALGCMLPRAILISQYPSDAAFESIAVFIVGGSVSGLIAFSSRLLRRERQYLAELETTHQELKTSEEKYRELFENAHDAIMVQDMDGNILTVNEASVRLTGYSKERLVHMKVTDLLSEEGLQIAREVRQKLLQGQPVVGSYEQQLVRENGSKAFLELSSSLVLSDGQPAGFQHIARDITEEKKMRENLRLYLQQTTKAQEEERKRISRELHDETIQELVVLSRQLDTLASSSNSLSEDDRHRLEQLQQQTGDIMKGVRRLSQDLRPAALDSLGLLPALEWLASDVAEYSGIETKVSVSGNQRRFSEEAELVLFRIVQEALRNVWRHSKATRADITVEFDQSNIKVSISDNGEGFTPPETMGDLARDGRLGLAGMQERARLINGRLSLQSKPGKGTTVTVEVSI